MSKPTVTSFSQANHQPPRNRRQRTLAAIAATALATLAGSGAMLTSGAPASAAPIAGVPAAQTTTYWTIVARHSGKCLDVAYASQDHAADVIQGTCWGGRNQQWTVTSVGLGYYEIVARHSGKCLDVAYASREHAANVLQGTCWGGTNQQWAFR